MVSEMTYSALDLWRTRDAAPEKLRAAVLRTMALLGTCGPQEPSVVPLVSKLQVVVDDLVGLE